MDLPEKGQVYGIPVITFNLVVSEIRLAVLLELDGDVAHVQLLEDASKVASGTSKALIKLQLRPPPSLMPYTRVLLRFGDHRLHQAIFIEPAPGNLHRAQALLRQPALPELHMVPML